MRFFLAALASLIPALYVVPAHSQSHAIICTREWNSTLNLRSAPNRSSRVIASVPNNAYVRTLTWVWGGDGQRWWNVEFNGLVGWMRGDYLCR